MAVVGGGNLACLANIVRDGAHRPTTFVFFVLQGPTKMETSFVIAYFFAGFELKRFSLGSPHQVQNTIFRLRLWVCFFQI